MKFSDEAWALYARKFNVSDSERPRIEAWMAQDIENFKAKAGGNELKALGLMTLSIVKDTAELLRLPVNFVLKQHLDRVPRKSKRRVKQAIRLARGGH